jgi:hypothetical protein
VGVGKIYHSKRDTLSFDNPNPGNFGAFGPFPDKTSNLDPDLPVTKYYDWGPLLEEPETADYKVAQYACRQIEEFATSKTPSSFPSGFSVRTVRILPRSNGLISIPSQTFLRRSMSRMT